ARRAWREHRHDVTQPKSGRWYRAHCVESGHRPERTVAPRNLRERGHSFRTGNSTVATALWAVCREIALANAPQARGYRIDCFNPNQFACHAFISPIQLDPL